MEASGRPRVWRRGRFERPGSDEAAMAAVCQAVERAVAAHQTETLSVRAVIVMFDHPAAGAEAGRTPVPVVVESFDTGAEPVAHDSGYGHGI